MTVTMHQKCVPWVFVATVLFKLLLVEAQICQRKLVYINQSGDYTINGLFNVYKGKNCDSLDIRGLRLIHAAHWTIDRLNEMEFIPGKIIGFKAIDSCGGENSTFRTSLKALEISEFSMKSECRRENLLGIIGPGDNDSKAKELLKLSGVPFIPAFTGGQRPEIKAIIQLLKKMNSTKVSIISFNEAWYYEFKSALKTSNMCTELNIILHEKASNDELSDAVRRLEKEKSGNFVLFGSEVQIHTLMTVLKMSKVQGSGTWIVSGLENTINSIANPEMPYEKFLVVQPDGERSDLDIEKAFLSKVKSGGGPLYTSIFLEDNKCKAATGKGCDYASDIDNFEIIQEAIMPVYAMALALKERKINCPTGGQCTYSSHEAIDGISQTSLLDDELLRKMIQVNISFYDHTIEGVKHVGSYHQEVLSLASVKTDFDEECVCQGRCSSPEDQSIVETSHPFFYRNETWVMVSLTISGCGTFTDLLVLTFIIGFVLRGRRTEGSQFFTMLHILGNMCLYACVLPYAFSPSPLLCTIKTFGPSVALAITFSCMLARCLLMITTDTKGFQGHISGLLQAMMFILMIITQLTLVAVLWWFKRSVMFENGACMQDSVLYFVINSYNCLLLFLLVISSPFAAKNRRNYKEGLQFTIANVLTLSCWIPWVTVLFTQDHEFHDPGTCINVVAIATIQLIVIFIPRACAIMIMPKSKSFGIPTVSGNHLSAASETNICSPTMRVYETINRGYVPDSDSHNGNPYTISNVPANTNSDRVYMYRKATII